MVNTYSKNYDGLLYDMEKSLEKTAKITYISLDEYKNFLDTLDCETLKNHDPSAARVPVEDFQKKKIYDYVVKSKCGSQADDKTAGIEFAIQCIAKIADDLDQKGFVEVANILDKTLQKFATLTDCKDCK